MIPSQPPSPTFGRRRPASPAPAPAATLSAEAERFRAGLAEKGRSGEDDFGRWRRGRSGGRLMAWLAAFALLTPGVMCFVLHAPALVSTVVEAVGVAANAWLRRERRRHLAAISAWTPQPD